MDGGELTREQALKRDIPWETYMTAKMITGTGLQLLRRYDHRTKEVQASLLEDDGPAYVKTFVSVLRNVSKDETVEYTLALIDELLAANPRRARFFHHATLEGEDVYGTLLRLLNRKKWFILETTCRILTLVISFRPHRPSGSSSSHGTQGLLHTSWGSSAATANGGNSPEQFAPVLATFIDWLCQQLHHPSHASRGAPTAVSALAVLLRQEGEAARGLFVKADGVKLLTPLVSPASSQQYMQLLYEAVLCVWLLSFCEAAVEPVGATRMIPRLIDVAKSSTKEKVVRVAILALNNLHSKAALGDAMVELGLPKVVQGLKMQAWGDEDLREALDTLEVGLLAKLQVLSSFAKYKQEVLSGSLDWTPMHRDTAFWRDNVQHFEDNDFQVLRVLVTLLDNSRDPRTLAVACSDLGQFISVHPSGRLILLDLKAKERCLGLMENTDPEVRKQALLTVQKLLLSAKYVSYLIQ
eukprot:TRINITY_DN10943_c0_g1_i2.p1 TRINITY_DN10943_c0_g1~~TRINITY_DN10943_c0_g1_i2.p1  ORF type:complete len:469 (+),score=141.03 TRINITY_DN10943_c0_g1_i2:158-1564(+)